MSMALASRFGTAAARNITRRQWQCRSMAAAADGGRFKLPSLPYEYDALEPHIDTETMKIHHSKHHATYVAGLNGALPSGSDPLESLQKSALAAGNAVRNHGGGHYNHAFFWVNMAPSGEGGEPSSQLSEAINKSFGSMDGMKEDFCKQALTRFGSGWAWLGVARDGSLAVTSTANQDNPLMTGLEYKCVDMVPILGLDVWEHAYYLKYQNRRPDYVAQFWNVVNWKEVSKSYENYALKGEPVPVSS